MSEEELPLVAEAARAPIAVPVSGDDFRHLAELAPVGLFQTDADGNCVYVNHRWRALTGLSLAQAQGRGWVRAIHPDDRDWVLAAWTQAAREGREYAVECRFCNPKGETIWISGRSTIVRDEHRQIVGFVGSITDVTERKLMERSLQTKEAQLRLVTDHAAVYIAHYDRQGRFKFVNRSYASRFGLTPEQCTGKLLCEVLGPAAYAKFSYFIERALGGEALEFEVEVPYERLGTRMMHCAYVPERDTGGNVVGWIASLTDVTERRLADLALQRSEQRFARFMQYLPGLAWIKDARGRYLYANDAALSAFQVSRNQLYGKTDFEIFPPETARQFANHDRLAAISRAGAVQLIEKLMHADGEVHHSLVSKFSLTDVDGTSTLSAGIAIDVSERLKAQQELQRHKERLELAQQAGRIGIFEWNLQSNCVEWSATAEELYGLEVGSFGGHFSDWKKLLHPEDRDRAIRDCENSVLTRSDLDTEFRIVRPDGEVRYIKTQARIHCDSRDRPLRMVGVNVDVTDWRITEAALREADLRKNEFLATLAHELRNPLAPLCNGLNLIAQSGGDPALIDAAREIMERQTDQLVHLVDDLLDVSRITRDKLHLRKENVDLRTAIQGAVEAITPLLDRMNHRLEVEMPPQAIILHADLTRLVQVLTNLLVNAAKFTNAQGLIRLTVQVEDEWVVTTVADNGIGIPPEELPWVFDMFHQVEHSLERTKGGLGIGLTLVRRLVEMHGGTVSAHSRGVGQGSEFRIRLPRVVATPAISAGPEHPTSEGFSGKRILVADDNADAALSLSLLLRRKGAELRTAHDGLEAIAVAAEFRPDVVVLDLGMPRLNGYDAARRIRQEEWGKQLVLIALSGWGQVEDRQRSHEAGFDAHLVKPADISELEAVLLEKLTPHPRSNE